jgi:hypothetical protein
VSEGDKKLADILRERVDRWNLEAEEEEEPKPPTAQEILAKVVNTIMDRADAGCTTAGFFMSTKDNAWGPGWLGTTDNPDEDERILEWVCAYLLDEDVMASCHREDVPDSFDEHYQEKVDGYTAVHLSVGWAHPGGD